MARNGRKRGARHLGPGLGTIAAALIFLSHPAAAGSSWDEIVKAANKEGEVDVHGGPGKLYEQVLTEGFRRAYPQIKMNFSGISGRDAIPKILREREAGLYTWDVYIGGTFSILQGLMPAGAVAPLRPALILPEVLDDAAWYGGLDGGWVDKEKAYILGFEATVAPVMHVNWDFVSHDDLKTYEDLLKPQFAGKIVWDDPRMPGQGSAAAQKLLVNAGADFLKQIFTKQKIVYIANPRQTAEWLAPRSRS
jgi:iron(III) transport system substrate-binding protein